jgi:predicted nucleic acid-binding protein
MSGSLIDANVLLDIATADANWVEWSQAQVRAAASRGPVYVNPIIYAELAPAFATKDELDRWLDPNLFQRAPLPYDAGWLAAQAFITYRRSGGARSAPLPDFYIGAHAQVEGLTLVSRDAARYRTYFPSAVLVAP